MIGCLYLDWLRLLSLNLVEDRGEYSPGLGKLVTPDKVHLRTNKHIQNQSFISFRQTSLAIPGEKLNQSYYFGFL